MIRLLDDCEVIMTFKSAFIGFSTATLGLYAGSFFNVETCLPSTKSSSLQLTVEGINNPCKSYPFFGLTNFVCKLYEDLL